MENAKDKSRNHPAENPSPAGKKAPKAGTEKTSDKGSSEWGLRRIIAVIAILLLVGLYLVTFILAVAGNENSAGMLRFCFGMTIFVPLFSWVMIWCAGYLTHKKTIASLDLLDSNPAERERMEEAIAREMGQESRAEKD